MRPKREDRRKAGESGTLESCSGSESDPEADASVSPEVLELQQKVDMWKRRTRAIGKDESQYVDEGRAFARKQKHLPKIVPDPH